MGRKVKGRCREEGGQYRWLSGLWVSIREGAQYVESEGKGKKHQFLGFHICFRLNKYLMKISYILNPQ